MTESSAAKMPDESKNFRKLTLTFHGIGPATRALDPGEDRVWLTRDHFHRVLDIVAGEEHVELTFDDGNISDVEHALPALRERRLAATFFVLTGRLGTRGSLRLPDLAELLAHGMDIGSHGMHHRPWKKLRDDVAEDEIAGSKAVLEQHIGQRIRKAACPFGAYDRRALHALKRHGFETIYTSDGGLNHAGQWLRARNTIGPDDDPSAIRALVRSAAGGRDPLMQRAKRLVKRLL